MARLIPVVWTEFREVKDELAKTIPHEWEPPGDTDLVAALLIAARGRIDELPTALSEYYKLKRPG